jgi:hypothetical protein
MRGGWAGDLTALDVACTLLLQFGAHSIGTGGRSVTVRLPPATLEVALLGDVVVRAGDSLVLEAELQSASLSVGRRQIRVERGGRLDLVRINIVDSVESSAVFSEGVLHLLNCTFERCVANSNVVNRAAEGVVKSPTDSGIVGTTLVPAVLNAWGGAVLAFWTAASVVSSGTTFASNAVRGARVLNAGGAMCAFGASVTLDAGTTFKNNHAGGGTLIGSRGGAVSLIYAQLDASNVVFLRNWAQHDERRPANEALQKPPDSEDGKSSTGLTSASTSNPMFAQGGALHLANSKVVLTSSRFEENGARNAESRSFGGAIFINDGSTLRTEGCSFMRNKVMMATGQLGGGGAIRVDVGGSLWVQNTVYELNSVVSQAEANGGAISSAGRLTLAAGNVFRANSVSGAGRSEGGAIFAGEDSALVARDGVQFIDDKVPRVILECCCCV